MVNASQTPWSNLDLVLSPLHMWTKKTNDFWWSELMPNGVQMCIYSGQRRWVLTKGHTHHMVGMTCHFRAYMCSKNYGLNLIIFLPRGDICSWEYRLQLSKKSTQPPCNVDLLPFPTYPLSSMDYKNICLCTGKEIQNKTTIIIQEQDEEDNPP